MNRIAHPSRGPIEYRVAGQGPAALALNGGHTNANSPPGHERFFLEPGSQLIVPSRHGYGATPSAIGKTAKPQKPLPTRSLPSWITLLRARQRPRDLDVGADRTPSGRTPPRPGQPPHLAKHGHRRAISRIGDTTRGPSDLQPLDRAMDVGGRPGKGPRLYRRGPSGRQTTITAWRCVPHHLWIGSRMRRSGVR